MRTLVLATAAIVAMLAFCLKHFAISTDITQFLADERDAQLSDISKRVTESELTRTIILRVGGAAREQNLEAAHQLAQVLAEHPEVAWVRNGIEAGQERAFSEIYAPRAAYFLAPTPEQTAAKLTPEGLNEAAQNLRHQLSLPTAPLLKQMIPQDPLLAFPALLERLQQAREGGLDLDNGRFVTGDGHGLVFLASVHPPFLAVHQAPLQQAIQDAFTTISAGEPALVLEQSGVGRFALSAERTIRADITRISVISTAGLALVFLLIFRSPRLVVLVLLPIAIGVLAACTCGLLLFGRIHGVTLAFGAALIGVGIDYAIHLFNHHMLDPAPEGAAATVRKIWPGLLLGATTTVAGFAGLAWTTFPGLREIAVFAGVGVLAAVWATRTVLPALMPQRPVPGRLHHALARFAHAVLQRLMHMRRGLWVVPLAAIVVCAIGLPQVNWVDDIQALNRLDPELLAEDERVRGSVSRMDAGRFVIAIGDSEAEALEVNDEVAQILEQKVANRKLQGFRSLHSFLWSPAQQRSNLAALRAPGVAKQFEDAITAAGFRPQAFAGEGGFLQLVRGEFDPPPPLTFADLQDSPLSPLVRSFRLDLGEQVALVTFLRGLDEGESLSKSLATVPNAYYFDHTATMAAAYRRYRTRSLELIAVGLLAVAALVFARYRRVGPALSAYVPACIAAATTLAILGLMGGPVHILHLVSLLLVLSMGVDYGVFLTEASLESHSQPVATPGPTAAALLSIVLACISTVLAFGLLGMSDYPALEAIGTTVGIGVVLSLVCAPVSLVILRRGDSRG